MSRGAPQHLQQIHQQQQIATQKQKQEQGWTQPHSWHARGQQPNREIFKHGQKKRPKPILVPKNAVETNLSSAGWTQILKKKWVQRAELKFLKKIGVQPAEPRLYEPSQVEPAQLEICWKLGVRPVQLEWEQRHSGWWWLLLLLSKVV